MSRILTNYARMAVTFAIGLLILRRLVAHDPSLFAVYSLVTVGLGLGVMVREAVRAALVSFMNGAGSMSADIPEAERFRQAMSVVGIAALLNLLLAIAIAFSFPVWNLADVYAGSFGAFVMLRACGAGLLIIITPYLNFLAFRRRMGAYNLWLVTERLVDLAAVEVAVRAADPANALVHSGIAYAVLIAALFVAFVVYCGRVNGQGMLPVPAWLGREVRSTLRSNLGGAAVLVTTMAFYFRFSLLLVNLLFGEAMGVAYAMAVQISSYLRQAVMGLVTGLDSYYLQDMGSMSDARRVQGLNRQVRTNALVLVAICAVLLPALPTLVDALDPGGAVERMPTLALASLFLIGVLLRAVSEPWMQMLGAMGRIAEYSRPLFVVAALTPAAMVTVHWLAPERAELPIGLWFAGSMLVSHCLSVPSVLARSMPAITLRQLLSPLYGVLLLAVVVLPSTVLGYRHFLASEPLTFSRSAR